MSDRIAEIEEQAKVILEWCRQQKELPKEEQDILELRSRGGAEWEWEPWSIAHGDMNFKVFEYRLRKRIKKHTATVYWYRYSNGAVSYRLSPVSVLADTKFLGTNTVEFTEPQE